MNALLTALTPMIPITNLCHLMAKRLLRPRGPKWPMLLRFGFHSAAKMALAAATSPARRGLPAPRLCPQPPLPVHRPWKRKPPPGSGAQVPSQGGCHRELAGSQCQHGSLGGLLGEALHHGASTQQVPERVRKVESGLVDFRHDCKCLDWHAPEQRSLPEGRGFVCPVARAALQHHHARLHVLLWPP